MRCLSLFLYFFAAQDAFAQPLFKTAYTQAAAYSTQQSEPFSFLHNAATMAWSTSAQAGFYGEQRFGLAELRVNTVAATLPFSSSRFGLAGQYCGSDVFNSSRFGFAYAQVLGNKAAVGALFQYHHWAVAGYGSEGSVGFSLGGQVRLSEELLAGLNFSNPVHFGKAKEATALPAALDIGLGYDVSKELFFTATVNKSTRQAVQASAACQYRAGKKLIFRIGADSESAPFFFGGGFLWGSFRIDAVGSIHPRLGFTPGLQIIYASKRAE